MFKSNNSDGKQQESRKTVVEKIETRGGVQTKTTTITCTRENFSEAFEKFNLDPEKFQAGGTSVTKQIIYTNSDGKKEVLEETVETYEDPLKNEKEKASKSKSFAQRLGFGKSSPKKDDSRCEFFDNKSSSPVPISAEKFEKECLAAHNDYRKKHGVPNLTLSKEMCAYAKEWAQHLSDTNSFKHRTERKYGENIFMKWSSDPSHQVGGKEAVDDWYSEIKDYTFGQEPRTLKAGHFSQVIWKGSQKVGVAFAKNNNGKTIVVANYDPPGNFVGKFSENVPPVKK